MKIKSTMPEWLERERYESPCPITYIYRCPKTDTPTSGCWRDPTLPERGWYPDGWSMTRRSRWTFRHFSLTRKGDIDERSDILECRDQFYDTKGTEPDWSTFELLEVLVKIEPFWCKDGVDQSIYVPIEIWPMVDKWLRARVNERDTDDCGWPHEMRWSSWSMPNWRSPFFKLMHAMTLEPWWISSKFSPFDSSSERMHSYTSRKETLQAFA